MECSTDLLWWFGRFISPVMGKSQFPNQNVKFSKAPNCLCVVLDSDINANDGDHKTSKKSVHIIVVIVEIVHEVQHEKRSNRQTDRQTDRHENNSL